MGVLQPREFKLRPTGSCVVRTARAADAEGVLECAAEVFATSPHTLTQPDEFRMTPGEEREFLESLAASPDQLFVVAHERSSVGPVGLGQAWGMLILKHPHARRKLRHVVDMGMSVRSSHRGLGVGTALLTAGLDWARARPELEIVTLAVYADNAAGLALYRRLGFVEYGRLPAGCKHDDGTRWDQVLMRLELRPRG